MVDAVGGLFHLSGSSSRLVFPPTGASVNVRDFLENNHTPKNIKLEFSAVINHTIITGDRRSQPPPTDGNLHIWNDLKDVLLDPYFAPLLADDLTGLPKTFVYTAVQDPLNNEGVIFGHRLREAGADVEHYNNLAGFHSLNSLDPNYFSSVDSRESNSRIRKFIQDHV